MSDEPATDSELGTLLIVDDDRPFQQRLARAMEKRGFVTETADSVREALDKLRIDAPPMRWWICVLATAAASMSSRRSVRADRMRG
jgi:ActR/RegA family two-component response regulator